MDYLQNVMGYFEQQQPLCAEHDKISKDLYQEFGVKAGLRDENGKGVLAAGMDADINVFDLEKLHQPGTYENPRCLAVGMDYVLVDGAVAVEKGRCTGVKAGRILRR